MRLSVVNAWCSRGQLHPVISASCTVDDHAVDSNWPLLTHRKLTTAMQPPSTTPEIEKMESVVILTNSSGSTDWDTESRQQLKATVS